MTPVVALLTLALVTRDSASLALRRRVWDGLSALERVEQHLTTRRATTRDTTAAHLLSEVRPALDTMVFRTSWGGAELEQLRLAFPGSPLLDRYAARLAERDGETAGALALVDRLLARDAADGELQRARGRLLERAGRPRDALDAYARALDLAPEDDSAFRSLERVAEGQGAGALDALLDQIRRLRIRRPESRVLADHEIEVIERLGVVR